MHIACGATLPYAWIQHFDTRVIMRVLVLQWAMPSYKLTYYNTTGLAEVTRYLFKLKNVPFEDVRLTREQWLELKPSEWN